MQIAQCAESYQKEREITQHLATQIGKSEQQPFGKVGEGNQCCQQKERALDHPGLGAFDIEIRRRSQRPGAPRAISKLTIGVRGQRLVGLFEQLPGPRMEGRQSPIAHSVPLQFANALAIEPVHICGNALHRTRQAARSHRITRPRGRMLRTVEQQ